MATQSPFLLLDGFLKNLPLPDLQPPAWAIEETQRRIVLLLNHILGQEKEATGRLARQKSRVVQLQWRAFSMSLVATPAGLLDQASADAKADLVLVMTEESPLALAQTLLQGNRPAVRIAGDVQLAAEVNWLADHVRWDLEEDLARVIGDVPAHTLAEGARAMAKALRQFVGSAATASPAKAQT